MDTKLTLKLDKEIIDLAKEYVKEHGTSLSKFVEDYLRRRVKPLKYELDENGISLEVREMVASFDNTGSVKLPDDFDYKEAIGRDLANKTYE